MERLEAILPSCEQLQGPGRAVTPPVARAVWERAVGSRIAKRAQPHRLEGRTLYVRVTSSAWANELSLLSDSVRHELQAQGVNIDTLRFFVGRLDAHHRRRRAVKPRPAPPPQPPLPSDLQARTAAIEHEPLRQALQRAAARALWFRKPR